MNIWLLFLICYGVGLLGCVMGFKKFVWFLSIGYGFSVILLGITYAIMGFALDSWDVFSLIMSVLFVVYGFRLSFFLLVREIKNANYQKVLKEATKEGEKKVPVFVLATIWIWCGFQYACQTVPALYRIANNSLPALNVSSFDRIVCPIIGLVICVTGIVIEALADKQKSAQKVENPNMVATKGLYKMVRCPNYFGEILFWTGVLVYGIQSYTTWWMWVMAIFGYFLIVYVMFNGAQRLDKRQEGRYGKSEEYRAYADKTPIIIPLLPVYHLGDYKGEKPPRQRGKKNA